MTSYWWYNGGLVHWYGSPTKYKHTNGCKHKAGTEGFKTNHVCQCESSGSACAPKQTHVAIVASSERPWLSLIKRGVTSVTSSDLLSFTGGDYQLTLMSNWLMGIHPPCVKMSYVDCMSTYIFPHIPTKPAFLGGRVLGEGDDLLIRSLTWHLRRSVVHPVTAETAETADFLPESK